MSTLGSIALLHVLRQQGWDTPMIFLTGHPMEKELEALRAQGVRAWVLKPPRMEQLAEVVAGALSA
jgi:CheY-like chemotaxis protein